MSGRRSCVHRTSGGACYECATGRPRRVIPGQVTPDQPHAEPVRVYHVDPADLDKLTDALAGAAASYVANRGWSRILDAIRAGDVD